MGIDELNPRQLAPSVGSGSADAAASSAPSNAIYNSATAEIFQIFGAFDFTVHMPATRPVFESMGDGISLAIGSFRFQVGQMGTLRMPDQPTAPAIAPASWFPPSIGTLSELNAPMVVGNMVSDSSRDSDLSDLATEDGTYGSGSESCGSSSFPNHFMCAIINAGDTSANHDNGGNRGNGTDPPNGGNSGNGGDHTNANNGEAVEPPTIVNEQTGERVVIRLNEQEWARCHEALRGTPLPFGYPQELLMGYHWLLKEEFKRQVQTIAQLEARKKVADESSLRRAGLSSYGGSSSKGNEHLTKKRQSRMAHLTEQERIEAAKVLDFGSMQSTPGAMWSPKRRRLQ